uniref:Uncharacterized protein n=1 Tax=Panagrolaimus superbus TaxID=310955 RepID=A0A914Z8M6_9BILA
MRILYQMKQDKDKEVLENNNKNHRYQSIARNNQDKNNLQSNEEIIDETKGGEMVQHGIVKRKLFFSAEFFEPHFMMNPPPMAEQFLYDLRKMIDLAKHRIHGKKHIPQLVSIPEETKEHYEPYMELQNRSQNLQVTTPTIYSTREEENSPKSVKSCDSGRESMRDASSTESVASSTDLNGPKARSPIPSLPKWWCKKSCKRI